MAGNLVTEKRNCLLQENVDRMLFLFENLNEEPLLLNEEDKGSEDEVIGETEDWPVMAQTLAIHC